MSKADIISEHLRTKIPTSKKHLRDYISVFIGVDVPVHNVIAGHSNQMDYIWHAFSSDFVKPKPINADCVVWANRGGGKTETAALVTVLDCIFKPEIQIRILSGSGYQAGRMYEYFEKFLHKNFADMIADVKTRPAQKTTLKNGAVVEVLVQSETSVRGQHVHKLRCDEVELFKEKVFDAAQFTTMSSGNYTAALEVISTMHKTAGLMKKLVDRAKQAHKPIFKWNIWDVIERCKNPSCEGCELFVACEGKARKGQGYFRIEDTVTQLGRTNPHLFNLEMLCGEGTKKKWGWRVSERRY